MSGSATRVHTMTSNDNSEGLMQGGAAQSSSQVADSAEFPYNATKDYAIGACGMVAFGAIGLYALLFLAPNGPDPDGNGFVFYAYWIFFFLFLLCIPYGVFCFLTAPLKARERLVVDSDGFRVVGPCGGCRVEKVNGKNKRCSWEEFREVGTDFKRTLRKDKDDNMYWVHDIDGKSSSGPAFILRDATMIDIAVYTPKGMTPEQFVANLSMMAQLHANQYEPTEFQHNGDAPAQMSADPAATSTLVQGSSASYAPPVVNQEQPTTASATPQSLAAFLAEQNLSQYEAALRE